MIQLKTAANGLVSTKDDDIRGRSESYRPAYVL